MALNKIKKNSLAADVVDATKIADDSISDEHIDVSAVTGHTELSAVAAADDVLLIFDTSANAIKKIQRSNVSLQAPSFSSVSPTNLLEGDGTGNHTIVITGSGFDATASFVLITDGGTTISMDSVTRNSATQLTGVVAKSTANLTNANEPFDIKITNGNSLTATALNQINFNASPAFVTGAGTLGTFTANSAITPVDIVAADPESAGTVTFDFLTGGLPAGLSSTTVHENGVSKLRISGTPSNPAATTTTTFTLRASDAASNTSTRAFSFTVNRLFTSTSFTSSGTFAVPSGVSNLANVLVVAGGGGAPTQHASGGGAGGLIFMPCVPVTPGGTIAVTVGCGGGEGNGPVGGSGGQDSVFGASPSPGISAALTAKGGGKGGHYSPAPSGPSGGQGGSGGGAGVHEGGCSVNTSVGQGIQPTQPGNSGAYGFGNAGGQSQSPNPFRGGGGGGAGAAGQPYQGTSAGAGGVGKAYTIADGTTPVFYAGGGGGGAHNNHVGGPGGQGGGGGGNTNTDPQPGPGRNGTSGQANKGGGGGSSASQGTPAGSGGKGIVVVRF